MSIVQGSAAAAKVIPWIRPGSRVRPKDLTANNGKPIYATDQDVGFLRVDKQGDFATALQLSQQLRDDIKRAFLMTSAIQRNAERVTAEEIRVMASEIEESLGGMYTVMSQELQAPLARRALARMERRGAMPPLPEGFVPVITTGLEALGRNAELQKVRAFIGDLAAIGGPEAIQSELSMGRLLAHLASGYQLEAASILKSEEEKQAEMQQAMQMQMMQLAMQHGTPEMMKAVAPGMAEQMGFPVKDGGA